jgi:hypothetical protein
MADYYPLRIVYVSGVPTIGEMQPGDTIPAAAGGTGFTTSAGFANHVFSSTYSHGILGGLENDDHPQYLLKTAVQTASGAWDSAYVTVRSLSASWEESVDVTYVSSVVSSVEGSTVSLSAYIAANEADWSTSAPLPRYLSSLGDTDIVPVSAISDHEILVWDYAAQKWTNTNDINFLSGLIGSQGDKISEVAATSGTWDSVYAQVLTLSDSWEESADVTYVSSVVSSVEGSTVSLSAYIAANEADWSTSAPLPRYLSGLGDTDITPVSAIEDHQILVWDEAAQKWINDFNDDSYLKVYNNTASAMSRGDVVHITGAHNPNTAYVALAKADAASSMPAIGVLYEDIPINGEGVVVTFGKADGMNTSGFTEGTTVYVSPTTAGALVNARPSGVDDLVQNLGIIMRSHTSNGVIKVTGVGRTNDIPNSTQAEIDQNAADIVFLSSIAGASTDDISELAAESSVN